ncbi:MAG: hypothetical protein ACRERD_06355 [Candidatus Binatia bacterium]
MDFQLTAEHRKLQETARRLGQDFAARAAQHDRDISAPIQTPSGDLCLFGIGMFELGVNPAEMLPPLKIAG